MPRFKLSTSARVMLADCIEVGLDGADGSVTDEETIRRVLEELRESCANETIVHIAPTPLYGYEIGGKSHTYADEQDRSNGFPLDPDDD